MSGEQAMYRFAGLYGLATVSRSVKALLRSASPIVLMRLHGKREAL